MRLHRMDKTHLSESDICEKFIRPAMEQAGWSGMDQIFREYPLRAGRVVVRLIETFDAYGIARQQAANDGAAVRAAG